MTVENRVKTTKGSVDVYVLPGRNEVQLASVRKEGGYWNITHHKRSFEAGSTIGEGRDADFVVTDEPLEFDRVSRAGYLVYLATESRGEVTLTRNEKHPFVLHWDENVKLSEEYV